MKLRKLAKTDTSSIIALEKTHAPDKPYYARYDKEALNFIFNNPKNCTAIGLFEDEKLIGWGAYRTSWHRHDKEKGVEISSIVINKNYRRRGLGKKILNHIISDLKQKKNESIFLTVSPKNTAALMLYLKNNFIIYDFKKNVYGKNSDRLYLRLNKY